MGLLCSLVLYKGDKYPQNLKKLSLKINVHEKDKRSDKIEQFPNV